MKGAVWLGGTLLAAGVLVVIGYGVYDFSRLFFTSRVVPLPLKVALPAIVVGLLVLLLVASWERLRRRKGEKLKEVEY